MSNKVALITGMAGGLARAAAVALHRRGFEIVGVDYRPSPAPGVAATVYQANYNKTKIEDIFRQHRPTHVLHLGRVGNLKERMHKRFDLNVIGSRKVMDLSSRYGVERLLVLSTFHIYGAHPHNHVPIYEDEPLRAGPAFPQIADAIQLDNQAVTWIYQHPECRTVLLRPCNVIGREIKNAMSTFLRQSTVPMMLGFNPMMQFIDARDLVAALVRVAEGRTAGVFNVTGPGVLPWSEVLETIGARRLYIPSSMAKAYLALAGLVSRELPPYLLNFLKYPCVIAGDRLSRVFDWQPQISQRDALLATVESR